MSHLDSLLSADRTLISLILAPSLRDAQPIKWASGSIRFYTEPRDIPGQHQGNPSAVKTYPHYCARPLPIASWNNSPSSLQDSRSDVNTDTHVVDSDVAPRLYDFAAAPTDAT